MNDIGRLLLRTAVTAALTGGVVALSSAPWDPEPERDAVIRLAWRFRSQSVDECRLLSPGEQAALPRHMRRTEVCERRLRPYRLDVDINGRPAVRDSIVARGAHADRPLSVFREIRLSPGPHPVRLVFGPYDASVPDQRLDTVLLLDPRQVAVVTLHEDRRAFTILTAGSPARR